MQSNDNDNASKLESRVIAEQLAMLQNTTPAALISTLIIASALAIYFWHTDYAGLWLAAAYGVILLRLTLYVNYKYALSSDKINRWGKLYTGALCCAGGLWGSALFIFGNQTEPDSDLLLAIVVVSSIAGGAYFSVSHRSASIGFILSSAFPLAVALLMGDSEPRLLAGTLVLFFIVILIRFAITFSRWFENSVRDRLAFELQTIELGKALEKAGYASKMQADFLANISHEIRTPMTGLLGMLQFLKEEKSPEHSQQYLQVALNSAQTLQVLVNDILDVSKLQSGTFNIDSRPCELRDLASNAVSLLRPIAEEKGLLLQLDFETSDALWISIDGARLRQILFNLISNAIKFTHSGSVNIYLNWQGDSNANYQIHCQVRDTGIGIPSHKIDSLFDRFMQLDTTLSRQHSGTGLGLAISRELLQLMGGTLSVKSELGKGSEFSFTLPAKKCLPQRYSRETNINYHGESYHLLIVDDNQVNLLILKKFISNFGYSANTAVSGSEAIDLFKRQPDSYDLILMDIQMPEMDGFETTQIIRSSGNRGKTIPIIAVTANIYDQGIKDLRDKGINDCVAKPIEEKTLHESILSNITQAK